MLLNPPPPAAPPVGSDRPRAGVRLVIALALLPVYGIGALLLLLMMLASPIEPEALAVAVVALGLGLPAVGLTLLGLSRISKPATVVVGSLAMVAAIGFGLLFARALPPPPGRIAGALDRVALPANLTLDGETRNDGSCFDVCPSVRRTYCVTAGDVDLDALARSFETAGLPVTRRGDQLSSAVGHRKIYVTVRLSEPTSSRRCDSSPQLSVNAEGRDG